MINSISKPYTVLYLGSLTHSDETSFLDRTKPHQDQIDFQNPTKIALIRIPRPGKDIYSRHISITQTQPIKNFEIYYRNLNKTTGRFCLLTTSNELLPTSTDDILITPKQPIFTDLLLIKGNFTKISFCIYGNIIRDENLLQEKCPNYRTNAPIEPLGQKIIQIKRDIFQQKREIVKEIQNSIDDQNNVDDWHPVVNNDGINEQQIENICNLSQKLLTTYTSQQFSQESFVCQFRSGLQQISANLAKIFKNKHLGLYYPSYEDSTISNDLPLSVTSLALNSLDLSLSQQFRGLEILKYVLQFDRHSEFFIQSKGVEKLIKIFVEFFKLNSVVLSTYKNLVLEVLICISHWKKAAQILTQSIKDRSYEQLFEQKILVLKQKIQQERQRSREKKVKKSRSYSDEQSSQQEDKKRKKDKQKKRNRSKQKKKGKQSRSKQQILKKTEQVQQTVPQIAKPISLRQEFSSLSFYEILLFELSRQNNIKQLLLIKILLEQILQTITKGKAISQRVSLSTSLLKDIKYIFNPAGEVLNTKSLKQFASCHAPFLNNVQSQGVDIEFISQREKLKNMKKYGICPKICKIINKISLQIASSQCQQTAEQNRTPFDQSFIVLMSQIIRNKQKSVFYGFGRILTTFKIGSSNDIIYLKKIQAAMTMISQYIYKILVQDNGLYTVLNIDQIYTSLINITNCLSKDPSAFTKQLKRKIRQLTNYAMAYDLFNRSEGNFKQISDYFLKLFKFQHYEINKINDFRKKQFDKLNKPFTVSNLSEAISLGSFHQLLPQQPLLQIDVYLKIFNVILQYNKNVWALFYENKLLCGFSVLYTKLSNIVVFLLQPSNQRQQFLLNNKKTHLNVQDYLNVLQRLLNILVKKSEYEAAFNDLIDEDNFESVQLYVKSFELYVSIFNALNKKSSLMSKKCKQVAQQILSQILQIYDKLLESYELTSHASRQSKIKQLWYMIYQNHFVSLKARAACLSLFAMSIQTMQNASIKLFNTYCIEEHLKVDTQTQSSLKGYLPKNDKSIIQNLIISNIFRSDPVIQSNFCLIIKNLLQKHSQKNPTCEKISLYLQQIFDSIELKLKQKGNLLFQSKNELILLEKIVLFTDILRNLNCSLSVKFEQKLLKHLRFIDGMKKECPSEHFILQQKAYKLSLKIKGNIILFLKKSFSQKQQHSQILTFIQTLNKNLDISTKFIQDLEADRMAELSYTQLQIEKQSLNLINISLEVVCSFISKPYNQSVLLYEVFLEKPYKPVPQLSIVNLFNKLTSSDFSSFITTSQIQTQGQNRQLIQNFTAQIKRILRQILIRISYFLCLLTTIQSKQFYSTQSRRNAIICLLTDDREFPFNKFEIFKSIIPREFIQTLRDYFAYPIIEKPLTLTTQDKKEIYKNKGYLFSKSVFAIIMEGEPTAKARYPYIGGSWKSGDISSNLLYTPSRQRDYFKIVKKSASSTETLIDNQYMQFNNKLKTLKQFKFQFELFQLITKKRTKNIEKKASVDVQTKILNIPLVLQNLNPHSRNQQNQMLKKTSPSPSNKYQGPGYAKSMQPLGNQYDGNVRRVSPSPPVNKVPTTMIGFNNPSNGFNNLQNGSNMMNQYGMSGNQSSIQSSSIPQANYSTQQSSGNMNQPGSQNIDNSSPLKPIYQYAEYPNPISSNMQHPTYPNPYYGGSISQPKPIQTNVVSTNSMPYLQMQKSHSQEISSQGVMRGSSNSAPRQNVQYGSMNYNQQQAYYGNNPNYINPQKQGRYDPRSNSPYQKNYPPVNPNPAYIPRQGYNPNTPSSYYPQGSQGPQGNVGGYSGSYRPQSTMISNNPRQNYQSNRPYSQSHNNPQYGSGSYGNYGSNQPVIGSTYPQQTGYAPTSTFGYNAQEQRQFNDAILLVTQLRGTLPEHLKTQKKNRLNQILLNNAKIQNRVKQYINNLK